jgi:hypothetical protein
MNAYVSVPPWAAHSHAHAYRLLASLQVLAVAYGLYAHAMWQPLQARDAWEVPMGDLPALHNVTPELAPNPIQL